MPSSRRELLASTATLLLGWVTSAHARTYSGTGMPWRPFGAEPPPEVKPGPWEFFTLDEGATVEALVDRLIPPDPETPGGKDCGCAVFIDRQLAGPFGSAQGLYMRAPFQTGLAQQGLQSPSTPAQVYRLVLAALNDHCRTAYVGKSFFQLPGDEQDKIITAMQEGRLRLLGTTSAPFFELVLQNTREGFFADPIYGGNRDMAGWKMIGFPGARYDYRDWVERHNERYPLPPVSIGGRKEWTPNRT